MIIFQMVAKGNSIQCYVKIKGVEKITEDCTLWPNGISKEMFTNSMQCVKNLGNITDSTLASKYLNLHQECLTKFDSCFYTDLKNSFDCTCPVQYITWIKPLEMKLGECKKWNENYLAEIVDPKGDEFEKDVNYLNERIRELSCYLSSRKWNPTMAKLKIAEKSRSINTYEVCTCGPDGCDKSAENKVTFKPDIPDDTTIMDINESTETTAFPNSKSDTSNNPVATNMDSDKSTEKSTFPDDRNETESGNGRKNVTKEIEPDNDKTTVVHNNMWNNGTV